MAFMMTMLYREARETKKGKEVARAFYDDSYGICLENKVEQSRETLNGFAGKRRGNLGGGFDRFLQLNDPRAQCACENVPSPSVHKAGSEYLAKKHAPAHCRDPSGLTQESPGISNPWQRDHSQKKSRTHLSKLQCFFLKAKGRTALMNGFTAPPILATLPANIARHICAKLPTANSSTLALSRFGSSPRTFLVWLLIPERNERGIREMKVHSR